MSEELPGGGATAGRLNIPVVGDYTGFRESLRAHIEEATRGLSAKISVEVDGEGLRERLEAVVQEAAAGVSATVNVTVDRNQVRSSLTAAVDDVRSKLAPVEVATKEDTSRGGIRGWFDRVIASAQARATREPIHVPVKEDNRSSPGGFLGRIRSVLAGAQSEADKNPIKVGFADGGGNGKGSLRSLVKLGMVSLIKPAVGVLGQSGAGLFSLAGSIGSSAQTLGALPALLATAATGMVGGKLAMSGFTAGVGALIAKQKALASGTKLSAAQQQQFDAALKNLSPAARTAAQAIGSVSGRFTSLRKDVQQAFFSKFADSIKPVVNNLLPVLRTQLTHTGSVLGGVVAGFTKWAKSPAFSQDTTTIMSGSNVLLKSFGHLILGAARAFDNLAVAAQPFIRSLAPALDRLAVWAVGWSANERYSGRFAATLDHARTAADEVGKSLKALYDGFHALFHAAMPEGDSLLKDMTTRLQTWARTMQSAGEQAKLSKLFADSGGTLRQVAGLIGDIGRGIGRIMQSQGFASLIAGLRKSLIPALFQIVDTVGQAGPAVLQLIGSLATLFSHLAGATPVLVAVLRVFNDILNAINALIKHVPILGTAIGAVFGARMLLNLTKTAGGLLSIEKILGRIGLAKVAEGSVLGRIFGGMTSGLGGMFGRGAKTGGVVGTAAKFGPELGSLGPELAATAGAGEGAASGGLIAAAIAAPEITIPVAVLAAAGVAIWQGFKHASQTDKFVAAASAGSLHTAGSSSLGSFLSTSRSLQAKLTNIDSSTGGMFSGAGRAAEAISANLSLVVSNVSKMSQIIDGLHGASESVFNLKGKVSESAKAVFSLSQAAGTTLAQGWSTLSQKVGGYAYGLTLLAKGNPGIEGKLAQLDGFVNAQKGNVDALELSWEKLLGGDKVTQMATNDQLRQSFKSLAKQMKDTGNSMDGTTKSGRTNRAAFYDLYGQLHSVYTEQARLARQDGADVPTAANIAYLAVLKKVRIFERDAHMTDAAKTSLNNFLGKVGLLPKASSNAGGPVDRLGNAINTLGNKFATARGNLSGLVSLLSSPALKNPINVGVHYSQPPATLPIFGGTVPGSGSSKGGHKKGQALGGLVSGPGTSMSDSIVRWLSNNEFVVRASSVKKLGVAFLNRLNTYGDVGKAWLGDTGSVIGGHMRRGAGALGAGMAGSSHLHDIAKALGGSTRGGDLTRAEATGRGPLVGGNLVLSTVPTDPRTAMQAAMFELHRLNFGGVYSS